MAKAATSPDLKAAFQKHLTETALSQKSGTSLGVLDTAEFFQ
jgi:ferritin-like metal-binding protein YciE